MCVYFHQNLINNINIVAAGNKRKAKNTTTSISNITIKIIKSTKIRNVLRIIPITREKTTNPSLYSFFSGLKKVRRKSGSEKS